MFSDCLRAEFDAAGIGLTTICPGVIDTNIVHTTRFDAPAGRTKQVEGRRKQIEKMFAAQALRTRQGGKGDRVGGQEEQADPARHAGGLPALRHVAGAAAGDAQHRPRQADVAG